MMISAIVQLTCRPTPARGKNAGDQKQAATQLRLGKLMLQRDADKARKYFERAIELAPDSPIAAEAKKLLDRK